MRRPENKVIWRMDQKIVALIALSSILAISQYTNSLWIPECQQPLGMEFGAIKDAQIQASSEFDLKHAAIQGRLNFQKSGDKRGAWSAKYNDENQWLQIDLQASYTKVTAVASQGRNEINQWVTKYKLQCSNDEVTFQYYKEQGQTVDKEFTANSDRNSIIYHKLNPPIQARYIRFRPVTWHKHISMRVEVYGFKQDSRN
ncbi:retinoschisin-like isoform X2 [Montipora capricornis]|uniref:retinoschisin-like isoform X2 n=1 Tax=Montipora capricornis TaxID=246305 RepID=UPI0035F1128E